MMNEKRQDFLFVQIIRNENDFSWCRQIFSKKKKVNLIDGKKFHL